MTGFPCSSGKGMSSRAHRRKDATGAGTGRAAAVLACAVALCLFAAACGGNRAVRGDGAPAATGPAPAPAGPKVAVAPMENRTNDLDASEIVRKAFVGQIAQQGWNVIPAEESDRVLRESLGITYGGQLGATTPGDVCAAVGAEAVFYGEVQEWLKTTVGVYNSIAVSASFRLYRKDGSLAWEGKDRQTRQYVPGGGGRDIGAQILGYAVLNLLNPMTPFGKEVGRNIGMRLPPGALEAK